MVPRGVMDGVIDDVGLVEGFGLKEDVGEGEELPVPVEEEEGGPDVGVGVLEGVFEEEGVPVWLVDDVPVDEDEGVPVDDGEGSGGVMVTTRTS